MKIITLCGSMTFFKEMMELRDKLESLGFVVYTPIQIGSGTDYTLLNEDQQRETKNKFVDKHLDKIKKSDAIVVANYDNKSIEGYIGANSFMEMSIAYALGKKIYLLKDIPEQENKIEIMGLLPVSLKDELESIR